MWFDGYWLVGIFGVIISSLQASTFVAAPAIACTGVMGAGAAALIGGLKEFLFGIAILKSTNQVD